MKQAILAAALATGLAAQADAAVFLTYEGATPTDTDSAGMADIDVVEGTASFFVSIVWDGNSPATSSPFQPIGFALAVNDNLEIASLLAGTFPSGVFSLQAPTAGLLDFAYLPAFASPGTLLTVQVFLAAVGAAPDDEAADLILSGSNTGATAPAVPSPVLDPLTGDPEIFAAYDVQSIPVPPIPVPAGIWLLGSVLGLLGIARSRHRA